MKFMNLKRFGASTLAAVMAMSMMGTAFAADATLQDDMTGQQHIVFPYAVSHQKNQPNIAIAISIVNSSHAAAGNMFQRMGNHINCGK